MARYTLTISPDYVSNWSVEDAVRELLQNAIDQENLQKGNHKTISVEENCLIISNYKSVLEKSSLLMGGGTKDGSSTIGQFGEGYKVALLVLLREGYKVEIHNKGVNELWLPKLVNSRIYSTTVLAIDTYEYKVDQVSENNLDIVVYGITNSEEILKSIWLDYSESKEEISVGKSTILLDKTEKGNIYIGGLRVANITHLTYGYNFGPGTLSVGRDRNVVGGYDLQIVLATTWGQVELPEHLDLVYKLITDKVYDVEWLSSYRVGNKLGKYIINKNQGKTVVSSQEDVRAVKESLGAVVTEFVPTVIRDIVYNSLGSTGVVIKLRGADELLEDFISKYEDSLSEDMLEDLNKIKERL